MRKIVYNDKDQIGLEGDLLTTMTPTETAPNTEDDEYDKYLADYAKNPPKFKRNKLVAIQQTIDDILNDDNK